MRYASTALLGVAILVALGGPASARAPRADLVVRSLALERAEVTAGGALAVRYAVANAGSRAVRRSSTGFYLSRDARRDSTDARLTPRRPLRRLRARRVKRATATVRVPAGVAAGAYRVIVCADDLRRARERNERNNCRASRRSLRVTTPPSGIPGAGNPGLPAQPGPGSGSAPPVLLAAGDIATCGSDGDEQTAALLAGRPGTVSTLGDHAYEDGTAAEFAGCYHPSWGAAKDRTFPSAGNREYNTPGASGYFGYFGAAAGDPAKGYYSYDLGDWHVVVLNTNKDCTVVACSAGSAQVQWLEADLAANPRTCTLAYWHHPLFSSYGPTVTPAVKPLWDALHAAGADLVLNGHAHNYERFAPQRPDGTADPAGIREFVIGTGGRSFHAFTGTAANSEARDDDTFGVLRLTLRGTGYDWEFIPVAGGSFADSGSGSCH
jgi:hypothetical protein